ncbi:MAG: response regulator [Pseudomonadota bacterium]
MRSYGASSRAGPQPKGVRVLLTEDDEAVRAFVRRALELDGHTVTTAEDGAAALAVLERDPSAFELLLTDVKMPRMDGIALAKRARELSADLIILLMTGFADQRERADELKGVVREVIPKPFTLPDLRQAVARALAEGKPV